MRQSLVLLLALLLPSSGVWGIEPCGYETASFEAARSIQIEASRDVITLQRRLRSELSSVSDIKEYYNRRAVKLRSQRSRAIADAAVAATACAIYSPSDCRRLSLLSRKISRLSTEIALLPSRERAALSRHNSKISRLYSEIVQAQEELGRANVLYIETLIALNRCHGY